jgi:hypothetical protein
MVELKGSLSGIGLQSLVVLIGELHHTGRLELSRGTRHAVLAFDDGRLVAAECGDQHGLQALGACAQEMADADFVFVEGPTLLEHTLDIGPSDLKRLLTRIGSDAFKPSTNGVAPHDETQARTEASCPMLGFADDRRRHYSRPTALHRCYAAGMSSLVTTQEQRELCLGDRFATCPRFRNAEHSALVVSSPEPPPAAVAQRLTPSPRMPRGVATRIAAAAQLHLKPDAPPVPPNQAELELDEPTRRPRPRSLVLIAGGVIVGLFLIGLLILGALPAMRPSSTSGQAASSNATTVEPAQAATVAPVNVAATPPTPPLVRPTPPPTLPAAPTAVRPAGIAALASALLDVRFAAGPQDRWVENAPYASWSDGAYRLQARDATRFVAVDVPANQDVSDAVVTATFRKTGGPPGGGYGLMVRTSGSDPRDGNNQEFTAYVFETGDLGEYGAWRREGDHWIDLVPWSRSAVVRSGGSPNELVVRALGTQLSLTVNGVELANLQDATLQSGGIGLFVGGDNNEVALDRFNVALPN